MFCGIDLGSRSVKIAGLLDGKLTISKVMETVQFYRTYGQRTDEGLMVNYNALGMAGTKHVVATGYGRNTIRIAGAVVIAELKAHVKGAIWQTGLQNFTLLDLGGQDSKVIRVKNGKMVDFQTNDKCAASTGRYLENMASILGLSLEELGQYSENPVELNATCAIFGETELIGRIVEGYGVPELAAGVNYTIFKRIRPMVTAVGGETIVFTGGVARGKAIAELLRKELGVSVIVPDRPQLNGAIGCAVYAMEMG